MSTKTDIRKLELDEIKEKLVSFNQPVFRAKQIYEWLWKKQTTSFEQMTNLPIDLRTKLNEVFIIQPIVIHSIQKSVDGTMKFAFKLHDGHLIEGVLIPTAKRATACISSQVGCSLTCKFCATGYMPRIRNLDYAEIFDQVVLINQQSIQNLGKPLTNIVFMGMGEPLLNYSQVMKAIDKINSPDGLGISAKRITVSTAGIAKIIKKMADDNVKFNLALSLHAADDEKRNTIMPINEQNNLESLIEALNYFYEFTGNDITFEYILLNGVNDSLQDAAKLVKLCRKVPGVKVNLIQYNTVEASGFTGTDDEKTQKFVDYLEGNRVTAKVRRSRGKDIDAACGQLANKG